MTHDYPPIYIEHFSSLRFQFTSTNMVTGERKTGTGTYENLKMKLQPGLVHLAFLYAKPGREFRVSVIVDDMHHELTQL